MILQPFEYFTIARQLADPSDATVYFIQAEIRDGYTDALIELVNLDSKGNGRWSKAWQVPADPSARGRYILVTTRVYDDASYTTLDQNYTAEGREYLIQRRSFPTSGGGISLTRKDIEEILGKHIGSLKLPEYQAPDLTPVLSALGALRMPEIPENDVSPILSAIEALGTKLEAMRAEDKAEDDAENTEDEKDYTEDLAMIRESMFSLQSVQEKQIARLMGQFTGHMEMWWQRCEDALKAMSKQITNTIMTKDNRRAVASKNLKDALAALDGPEDGPEEKEPDEPATPDYSGRAEKLTEK